MREKKRFHFSIKYIFTFIPKGNKRYNHVTKVCQVILHCMFPKLISFSLPVFVDFQAKLLFRTCIYTTQIREKRNLCWLIESRKQFIYLKPTILLSRYTLFNTKRCFLLIAYFRCKFSTLVSRG